MTGVGAANRFWLASMAVEIAKETGRQVSFLRLVDISIWMEANGHSTPPMRSGSTVMRADVTPAWE